MSTLSLNKFDLSTIKFEPLVSSAPTIVAIGKRGTGKSVLIKDIMSHFHTLRTGTVICPTEEVNEFYSDIVPKIFIHPEYKPIIVNKIIQRQRSNISNTREQLRQYGRLPKDGDTRSFLILDDCMYDGRIFNGEEIRFLFMNGRHIDLIVLITMQYPLGVPPSLRTNIDYVFILRDPIIKNRKIIYDNYAGMFPTFESFCEILDQCTQNFECLVIKQASKSNKIQDMVFWYKADNSHRPFKLCDKQYWDVSKNPTIRNNEYDGSENVRRRPKVFTSINKLD
jgi:hypothetical protein